jgi:hypothetical protein
VPKLGLAVTSGVANEIADIPKIPGVSKPGLAVANGVAVNMQV